MTKGSVEQLDSRPRHGCRGGTSPARGRLSRHDKRRSKPIAALGGRRQGIPEAHVVRVGRRCANAALLEQSLRGLVGRG
ncbi:MAG: hypothetical protein ABI903_08410 [Actinomycetota bacterium]